LTKIAHIGAGSSGFGKRFLTDILTRPSLAGSTVTLMDVDQDNLEIMSTIARRLAHQLGSTVRIESTTDRRAALEGADYVIVTIVSNGFGPRFKEVGIAQKYGVNHTVGCTTGPAGIFRGLRYIPVLLDLADEMERVGNDPLMLDYSNPTPIVTWAMAKAGGFRYMGLCHSVQHTAMQLARYIHPCHVGDLPPQCAAVNRMRQGQDELAVKAALEGDRLALEQAVALDPLTASKCSLEQVRDMVSELLVADGPYLPQFQRGRDSVAVSGD
jgi:alpha-galactosidase